MKKNYNKQLFESTYKAIMNNLAQEVKKILAEAQEDIDECGIDECGDEDIDECSDEDIDECGDVRESYRARRRHNFDSLNEMARAAVKRTINPKSMANVRDAASRAKFNEDWATNLKPLQKFDDVELLHRYVAALLIFKKECPQTEEDIDEIGIFKNYAHKLIDEGTGTIDDIITLYNQQDKIADRTRRGTTRAFKKYRSDNATPAAPTNNSTPSEDFDFDNETVNEPAPEVVDTPEPEVDNTPDYPDYDEVETEPEAEETPDYPDYNDAEESEADEEEIDIANNIPDFDDEDEDEDEEPTAQPTGEIKKKIRNMYALEPEEFEDPEMNSSFIDFNDDYIMEKDGKIGFYVTITNDNGKTGEEQDSQEVFIGGDTFADALTKFYILIQASLNTTSSELFTISAPKLIGKFRKQYINKVQQDDDRDDELEEAAENFQITCFDVAKTTDDIVAELDKL